MKRYSIKSILLILTLVGFYAAGYAQNAVTPYSMYGYGIIGDRATSMQRQMGSIGYAMNSGRQINVMNPASYAAADSLTFLFDMGADVSMLWNNEPASSSSPRKSNHSVGGGLDYITMQFPICKFMGASIGMLPYTSVGYAFGNEVAHGTTENTGQGGINQAYLGVAGKYAGVSLGINVVYQFGNIVNDDYAYPSTSGKTLLEHVMEIRDFDINLGLQYNVNIKKTDRLTLGLTYAPKKSLHGKSWATIQELNMESAPDTIGTLRLNGNYYTPTSIGAGVAYRHERISRWMVEFDFTWQNWADAKYSPLMSSLRPGEIIFDGMKFANRTKFALGGELVPKIRGNYGQRIAYRLGAYYIADYLKISGNQMKEYGISCGVGLHTPQDKTMVNVGLEWKHRQTSPVNLLSENYLNVTVGINFNEVWFWQRKIR